MIREHGLYEKEFKLIFAVVRDNNQGEVRAERLVVHVMNTCKQDYNVMGRILVKSAPFLFPCTIEYR